MQIKAIGYFGIGASDPLEWLQFCTKVIGMMPARAVPGEGWGDGILPPPSNRSGVAADGSVYLKIDERQWRIGIHPHHENGALLYLGLEVDGPREFAEAVAELEAHKIKITLGSAADAYARAVTGIARFCDPVGNNLELYYGPTTDYKFASPYGDQKFIAGHLGAGHLNLFVSDQKACFDFYTRVLGFRLTDYFRYGMEASLQFLHCNARHHSLAMIDYGGIDAIQHMLVEVSNIDEVGQVLDRAKAAGVEISSSLGRHRNDRMLSFYMRCPGGFDVEVGCEGQLLDDTWRANEFCEGDVWGHDGLIEAVQGLGRALAASRSAPKGKA